MKKAKKFFFEKKNQKTFFAPLRAVAQQPGSETNKSFLVLFFKKELLSSFPFAS